MYVSTHLRFFGSLCFYTTVRFYTSAMLLYADCQSCFTPLYDSTHLWCYCTPTVSFVLYHCTFLRIYVSTAHFAFTPLHDATVRRLSVLVYTTVRSTHLRFYGSLCFYTTGRFYTSTMLLYADCQKPRVKTTQRNKIELRNRFTCV